LSHQGLFVGRESPLYDSEKSGEVGILAEVAKIRKEEFNQRNNKSNTRFLRPTMFIRIAHC